MCTSEEATSDVAALHDKLDRKKKVENTNETVEESFRKKLRDNMDHMKKNLQSHTKMNLECMAGSNTFLGC